MKVLQIATLGRPRGLRGDLFVMAWHAGSGTWAPGTELLLIPPGDEDSDVVDVAEAELTAVTVDELSRGSKGRYVVRLAEVHGREAAEDLAGYRLALPIEALDEPDDPDEFWFYEMPGWSVELVDGEVVGRVVGTMATTVDLLEVRPARGGHTFYVPMVGEVVRELDRERRVVVVESLEGLLP